MYNHMLLVGESFDKSWSLQIFVKQLQQETNTLFWIFTVYSANWLLFPMCLLIIVMRERTEITDLGKFLCVKCRTRCLAYIVTFPEYLPRMIKEIYGSLGHHVQVMASLTFLNGYLEPFAGMAICWQLNKTGPRKGKCHWLTEYFKLLWTWYWLLLPTLRIQISTLVSDAISLCNSD